MGCRQATHGHNRATEERFYIDKDRVTLCGPEKVSIREVPRNTKAASVPHLPVAVRPYTLNGREERGLELQRGLLTGESCTFLQWLIGS